MKLRYILLLILLVPIIPVSGQTEIQYEITWSYENKGAETYNLTVKDLGVPVFPNTTSQSIRMELNYPEWEIIELNEGFLKAVPINAITLQPGEEFNVTAHYIVTTYPKQVPALSGEEAQGLDGIPPGLQGYVEPNDLYPWDNPDIIELSGNLTDGETSVLGKTMRIVDWFSEYSSYTVNELPKRPWATVRDPRGDCDDLGLLFISMCRSQGIPAFLQGGIVFSETLQLDESDWDGHYRYIFDGAGWHAWAMVYIPPWGWLPVDLTMVDGMRPVETITEAYYWRESTITMWNITSHDYVQDEVNQRQALMESDVYWVQRDTADGPVEQPEDSSQYVLVGVAAVTILMVYLKRRQ